jgi:16S rRNA (cytosine967-C5)-methyltransferase
MRATPARQAAYEILRRVESGRDFAVDLLESSRMSSLKEADRHLVTEIVMGLLRWRGELDFQIERLSSKPMKYFEPEIATILRMGIYQIHFLGRIPKSAAVNEAVELAKFAHKRSAAGLVNAVLRKCQRPERIGDSRSTQTEVQPDEDWIDGACRSLPEWLRERWEGNFGREGMTALAVAGVQVPPTALRVVFEDQHDAVRRELKEEGIETRLGKFAPSALVVKRGSVRASAVLREGRAVIQDEASQLVASLLAPRAGERVLDLCAAPGIKTGQLAMAQGSGLLLSCDLSARRLRMMPKLLPKSLPEGLRLERVRLDAARRLPFRCKFDRILVDAPCSGTGTLARNPEIKSRLAPEDLPRLAGLQGEILRKALEALAPQGRLVYVTCSLEPEENEQVIERLLGGRRDFRLLSREELSREFPHLKTLFDDRGFLHTRPDQHEMDGFFAAVSTRVI